MAFSPAYYAMGFGGMIIGSQVAALFYNVDYSAPSKEDYFAKNTKAEIRWFTHAFTQAPQLSRDEIDAKILEFSRRMEDKKERIFSNATIRFDNKIQATENYYQLQKQLEQEKEERKD